MPSYGMVQQMCCFLLLFKKIFFYSVSEVISFVNQEKKIDAARNDNVRLMTE